MSVPAIESLMSVYFSGVSKVTVARDCAESAARTPCPSANNAAAAMKIRNEICLFMA